MQCKTLLSHSNRGEQRILSFAHNDEYSIGVIGPEQVVPFGSYRVETIKARPDATAPETGIFAIENTDTVQQHLSGNGTRYLADGIWRQLGRRGWRIESA